MLTFMWRRLRATPRGVSRQDRRALSRLARPPRGQIEQQAAKLRGLTPDQREAVLRLLPTWQVVELRRILRQTRQGW